MNRSALAARIDHTALGTTTTIDEVGIVLDEARTYGMNACIPPSYLQEAVEIVSDIILVSVVGFPLGHQATAIKRAEAVAAWEDGADELDVVINVGRLKSGQDEAVRSDLEAVVEAVPIPIKAIVEAPLLTTAEKRRAASAAVDAGATYLKTATGFADGGATVDDVELLSAYAPVKASGGLDTWQLAEAMLDAGAERIGASAGVSILQEFEAAI